MKQYIIITLVTLIVGVASAASGICIYRKNVPKPLRLILGVVCPRCNTQGPVRQYTEVLIKGERHWQLQLK